jgi:kynurenine formamidase
MSFPAFGELPQIPQSPALRHSWDVFGRDDNLGTINRITGDVVAAAAALIRSGERVGLCLPVDEPKPTLFGRPSLEHVSTRGEYGWNDTFHHFDPQATTQWDGLRHIRGRSSGHYTGWDGQSGDDPGRIGVSYWADQGIVTRGLLADVHSALDYDPMQGYAITVADLEAALATAGVSPREGDVLCVRTGWTDRYHRMNDAERADYAAQFVGGKMADSAGLKGDATMAEFLWDSGFAAVAVDNPGVEVSPGEPWFGTLHRQLIPGLGFAIGELFDFGPLSEACLRNQRAEFFFASVPLKITGGAGSTGNAVAIF